MSDETTHGRLPAAAALDDVREEAIKDVVRSRAWNQRPSTSVSSYVIPRRTTENAGYGGHGRDVGGGVSTYRLDRSRRRAHTALVHRAGGGLVREPYAFSTGCGCRRGGNDKSRSRRRSRASARRSAFNFCGIASARRDPSGRLLLVSARGRPSTVGGVVVRSQNRGHRWVMTDVE